MKTTKVLLCANQLEKVLSESILRKLRNLKFHSIRTVPDGYNRLGKLPVAKCEVLTVYFILALIDTYVCVDKTSHINQYKKFSFISCFCYNLNFNRSFGNLIQVLFRWMSTETTSDTRLFGEFREPR